MSHALTADQLRNVEIVTRCASALSVLGIITIITTFSFSPHFRNPIHRLIFINAFFNLLDAVATIISVSGPRGGNDSALCQFQGFLMQMFPVADVLWTTAMACDVFLIVFRQYDAASLRKLELRYVAGIASVTFIPALVFLFIRTPEKGPMYGGVTLWCAISPNWVLFRIILYYVPIWTFILATIVLYFIVGIEIFKRRQAFKSISLDTIPLDNVSAAARESSSGHSNAESNLRSQIRRVSKSSDGHEAPSVADSTSRSRSNLSFRQYILMPVMFFVVLLTIWVAPTTNRVASLIDPTYVSYPLLLAVGSTGSLRGFWNGVVYITIGLKAQKTQRTLQRRALEQQGTGV